MTQMTKSHPGASPAGRAVALAGGGVFLAALGTFAACYAWVYGADAGPWTRATAVPAVAIDLVLFSVFALHHSVFARSGLKDWVATVIEPCMERSTYVWIASVLFLAVLFLWQPVGGLLWRVEGSLRYVDILAARPDPQRFAAMRATLQAAHHQLHHLIGEHVRH